MSHGYQWSSQPTFRATNFPRVQPYAVQHPQPQSPVASPPSPSPPPPPKFRHWDRVFKDFMEKVGLKQALNGFEADLLVMNSEFERKNVPGALADVLRGIITIQQGVEPTRTLEERKLEYVHAPNPASPSSLTKSISTFLAQNRARNDASNRAEFLHSLTEKSKRPATDTDAEEPSSSCARTDAKPVDRAAQMKYDIARNVDGPLRRTTRQQQKAATDPAPAAEPAATRPRTKSTTSAAAAREAKKASAASDPDAEKERQIHSGQDGRITDIETHFAVRYVPAPPSTLLARLRFLEEHIIKLEKDYPPWAALHFNQPNRGWPPPPRLTPIIVPAHMRSGLSVPASAPLPANANGGAIRTKNTGSSLQRAVLEQLAMREARVDLASGRAGST